MKPCIIVDIDGTLADASHRIHLIPKGNPDGSYEPSGPSWEKFHAAAVDDPPIPEIIALSNALSRDYPIVLCTGRGEETQSETADWLHKHGIAFSRLMMRAYKDHRPDTVVKKEMLVALRADGLEPLMVIEDRSSVVAMWRAEGIRCLQVCEGDY